jgi:hypothetical protein
MAGFRFFLFKPNNNIVFPSVLKKLNPNITQNLPHFNINITHRHHSHSFSKSCIITSKLHHFNNANGSVWINYASSSSTVATKDEPNKPHLKIRDTLDLSFSDGRQAYRSKSTWEILRAYLVFKLCSINYLVENNDKVK